MAAQPYLAFVWIDACTAIDGIYGLDHCVIDVSETAGRTGGEDVTGLEKVYSPERKSLDFCDIIFRLK